MAVFHCPAQLITVASICNQCVAGACLNVLYPTVSQRRGLARGAGRVKVRTDPRILPGNREDAHVHGNAPTLTRVEVVPRVRRCHVTGSLSSPQSGKGYIRSKQ